MKLNDCTKDELIYLIRRYGPRPIDFDLPILFYRQVKVLEQCHICQNESCPWWGDPCGICDDKNCWEWIGVT